MTKTPQRCLPIPPAIEVGDESTALGVQPNKLLENSPLDQTKELLAAIEFVDGGVIMPVERERR